MNLMVDLETLDINNDAPIITIGACYFVEHNALDDTLHQAKLLVWV